MSGIPIEPGKEVTTHLYVRIRIAADGEVTILPPNVVRSTDALLTSSQRAGQGPVALELNDVAGQTLTSVELSVLETMCDATAAEIQRTSAFLPCPSGAQPARLAVSVAGKAVAEFRLGGKAPTVAFTSAPTAGATAAGPLDVKWTSASDTGTPVRHSLWYSHDGIRWLPVALDVIGQQATIDLDTLPASKTATLRLVAVAAGVATEVTTPGFAVLTPDLSAAIGTPASGFVADPARPFTVDAHGSGPLVGPINDPTAYQWSSDLDGVLGFGIQRRVSLLTPGTHQLSVDVAAPGGASARATVAVRVARSAVTLLHVADPASLAGDSTRLSHPALDGNHHAVVQVTQVWNPAGSAGVYNPHGVGVWYDGKHWSIFNEDSAPMPVGAGFIVSIADPGPTLFTHVATEPSGDYTLFSHPLSDGTAGAAPLITANWNPGSSRGVYCASAIGAWYDAGAGRWGVYTQSRAPLPIRSAYNVEVCARGEGCAVHVASVKNIWGNSTYLDVPAPPDALIQASAVWNAPGSAGVYNPHPIGVWYDATRAAWAIFNQDRQAMPQGAAFTVAF